MINLPLFSNSNFIASVISNFRPNLPCACSLWFRLFFFYSFSHLAFPSALVRPSPRKVNTRWSSNSLCNCKLVTAIGWVVPTRLVKGNLNLQNYIRRLSAKCLKLHWVHRVQLPSIMFHLILTKSVYSGLIKISLMVRLILVAGSSILGLVKIHSQWVPVPLQLQS